VEPDSQILHLYHELQSTLNDSHFRWIDPDNLHLTFRFIGNTEESQINAIVGGLNLIIPTFSIFKIQVHGLGVFDSRSFPRVLWAGIKMPENAFVLVRKIETVVCDAGIERVTNPYSPHLTLCRIKNLTEKAGLFHFLDKYKDVFFAKQEITEINLYESILKSSGSVYTVLHSFSLNNDL
jgi:2'-5' RNA ligase